MDKLQFKISAALKNLIGKELITDEYVAIFELVKNSFDAYATKVEIIFENLYVEHGEPRIIVKDNGKGMSFYDLENKWLFVAYSAKADGTEDINAQNNSDYRNKITVNRTFAGAKGIGRFSCDRLGKNLNLITIKDEPEAKIENLFVNWEEFEEDQEELFVNIDVTHKVLETINYKNFEHGTILEITNLRDEWNRDKLLKLKYSLEKLINPNQENDARNFEIELIAREESQADRDNKNERDRVNGLIKNFLFETLELKTTQIKTEIVDEGSFIISELIDRGKRIYKVKEKNQYNLKSNIKIHLFQLNQAAKINFRKIMGFHSVEYGSIYLYKNGFRIYPFGEEGIDLLGIDRRKQQGYARYLGTREILGRIEINDRANIDDLKETTSRDGGLIKNDKYENLVDFFFEKALRRLEKYVVDLIKWGEPLKEFDGKEIKPNDIRNEILSLISNMAKNEDVIDLDYDKNFLNVIKERAEENLPQNLKSLKVLAEKTDNPELQKKTQRILSQTKALQEAYQETQKEKVVATILKKDVEEELKQVQSQNLFLKSISTRDFDQVVSFLHQIGIYSNTIDIYLNRIRKKIKNSEKISNDELSEFIDKINFENRKIISFSKFATKAGYKYEEQVVEEDLISFVSQYITQVKDKYDFKIDLTNKGEITFIKQFRPIEIILVVDTFLSNSQKQKPSFVKFNFGHEDEDLVITIKDDGNGLHKSIKNPSNIFEKGYTTTSGSGVGLFFAQQIVKKLKGTISVNADVEKGIEFKIRIK
ncbi:MAG: sensor histidine kinase [Ignavibacteriales bacterium]|nr:MAG: sensor histidine kinase [Ignavibacteriales bacterium]